MTQTLQKRFPAVYQEFFSQCTKVASAPHSFFWFGDLSGLWGGTTVVQKLPIRFYVGLQPIAAGHFEVESEFQAYDKTKDRFEPTQFDGFLVERIKKLDLKGYRLRFLSEVSIGVSLGAVGALSASIARLTNPKANAKELFKKAWEIARILQDNQSSGAAGFAALSESASPIVFRSDYPNFTAEPIGNDKTAPSWPIDFGLVFSGKIVKGETVRKSIDAGREQLERSDPNAWQTYLAMLELVTKEGVKAITEMLAKGADEHPIERLFTLMNQYQNLLKFVSLSTPEIDEIYGTIHQIANKAKNHVGSGAKLTGIGKGGMVLVALPFGANRDLPFTVNYASWRDGLADEPVRIEQDIDHKLRSDFLKQDLVEVNVWDNDRRETELVEYPKLNPKKFDLLLDTVNQRVFIKGKPVDSTKLPSQKAVVTIVGKLLRSGNWQLANSEIPLTTYANSRYDLHGKVVIPFLRALNGGTKSNFSLTISGGLYDDYILKLEANRLRTGLVKRLD